MGFGIAKKIRKIWANCGGGVPGHSIRIQSATHDNNYLKGVRKPQGASKNCLLIYSPEAFSCDNQTAFRSHTRFWRCNAIADLISERGYAVDAISWLSEIVPPQTDYELIVGFGYAFQHAVVRANGGAKSLYIGTGVHPELWNDALLARQLEVMKSHGVIVPVSLKMKDQGASVADWIGVVGDKHTILGYESKSDASVVSLRNSVTVPDISIASNINRKNQRSFLWMAAYGSILRRLDVVLDVFRRRPSLELTVCGGIEHEKDFYIAFSKWLKDCPNIHYEGFLDISGEKFREINSRCGWMVYPSAADGQPGSVVNAMLNGLVPIVTPETGINVEGCGIVVNEPNVRMLGQIVDQCVDMPSSEFMSLSKAAMDRAKNYHTREGFVSDFRNTLDLMRL